MMSDELKNFFANCGTKGRTIEVLANTPFEKAVIQFVDFYDECTPPGQGIFFDLEDCPEYKQAILDYLVNGYGWILEKPFFIRKPKNKKHKAKQAYAN